MPQARVRPAPTVALLAIVFAAAAAAADWPQFRGPQRDGIAAETGLLRDWPADGPQLLWRKPLGQGFSGVAAVDGRLYTMFGAGKDEFLICLDAADGAEIWRLRTGQNWQDSFGNGPRSTPTVHGDTVYALGAWGDLVAVAAADGKLRWRHDLRQTHGAKPPQWGVSSSPLVEDQLLLVAVGGKQASVVGFDRKSGKEVWRSQADRAGYAAPLALTAGGVRQVLFFTGSNLVSLNPADGSLYWKLPWKTDWDVNAATPVFVEPDRVFVSSGYGVGAALLRIRDEAAGAEELWRSREMRNKFSSSVLRDGQLYGFDEGTLRCLDIDSGKVRWSHRGLGHGSLIWADGQLLVLGDKGTLVLVEATPEAYRERATFQAFRAKSWTMPTLSDGRLYLRDEKELLALKVGG